MNHLSNEATDADLLRSVEAWAALLEAEDYEAAYAFTDHEPRQQWTPALMRQVIQGYGDARPGQKVTVSGTPTDVEQRREVTRWPGNNDGVVGDIWYDLHIDGVLSDLTATFDILATADGLRLRLDDIHVM